MSKCISISTRTALRWINCPGEQSVVRLRMNIIFSVVSLWLIDAKLSRKRNGCGEVGGTNSTHCLCSIWRQEVRRHLSKLWWIDVGRGRVVRVICHLKYIAYILHLALRHVCNVNMDILYCTVFCNTCLDLYLSPSIGYFLTLSVKTYFFGNVVRIAFLYVHRITVRPLNSLSSSVCLSVSMKNAKTAEIITIKFNSRDLSRSSNFVKINNIHMTSRFTCVLFACLLSVTR